MNDRTVLDNQLAEVVRTYFAAPHGQDTADRFIGKEIPLSLCIFLYVLVCACMCLYVLVCVVFVCR